MDADEAGANKNFLLVRDDAALSGGLNIPGFLVASSVVPLDSELFPVAAGFGAFPNVNVMPGPVLVGLKVKVELGLGVSLTSSPWRTLRPRKGPRESS